MRRLPPGGTLRAVRRNFTFADYVEMCRNGEAKFSMAEAARVLRVSRAELYRWQLYATIPTAEFRDVVDTVLACGLSSSTAVADEIKRRTGKARTYHETCPHCGGVIRMRHR